MGFQEESVNLRGKTTMFFVIIKDSWIEKCLGHFQNVIDWFNQNEGFVSVILALLTILATVLIPLFIAKKQNKIALYDKRLECYRTLSSIVDFCEFISQFESFDDNTDQNVKPHSPIEACKNKYIFIHDGLNDKARSQMNMLDFWKIMFTRNCINNDKDVICVGAFLTKAISLIDAKEIADALSEFVNALFKPEESSDILSKRNKLIEKSKELKRILDDLCKYLELK